jgi:hypothetical protein
MATVIKKGASKAEVLESIRKAVQKNPSKEISQLSGTLKSKVDPLEYQKKIRDEWK